MAMSTIFNRKTKQNTFFFVCVKELAPLLLSALFPAVCLLCERKIAFVQCECNASRLQPALYLYVLLLFFCVKSRRL